jgi:hypothetical protein
MIQSATRKLVSLSFAESCFFIHTNASVEYRFNRFSIMASGNYAHREPVNGLQVFCAGKNLLNQNAREFYYTDKVPFMLMSGFSYQLP